MQKIAHFVPASTLSLALAFGVVTLAGQGRPAGATGECKDGTFSTAASKSGACSSHGGVKTWFADEGKGVKGDAKAVGKSTKDLAKDSGKATKDTASTVGSATAKGAATAGSATKDAADATGKAAAKGAKATGNATKDAAGAVKSAVTPRPSDAPKDATGKCKDGTYTEAKEHSGACSSHGGVAAWYK